MKPCVGCDVGCFQCAPATLKPAAKVALACDTGDLFGAALPLSLPAPTKSSLGRTVVIYPEDGEVGAFCQLHIEDAERSQGLAPGYTEAAGSRTQRFKQVGNAVHAKVRLAVTHHVTPPPPLDAPHL